MFKNTRCLLTALTIIASLTSPSAFSLERNRSGTVSKVVTTGSSGKFGGCAVQMSVYLGNGCSYWASFSCTGEHNPKDAAYTMFDNAQLAMALSKPVKIWVDDTNKHDGYCVATRLEVGP